MRWSCCRTTSAKEGRRFELPSISSARPRLEPTHSTHHQTRHRSLNHCRSYRGMSATPAVCRCSMLRLASPKSRHIENGCGEGWIDCCAPVWPSRHEQSAIAYEDANAARVGTLFGVRFAQSGTRHFPANVIPKVSPRDREASQTFPKGRPVS